MSILVIEVQSKGATMYLAGDSLFSSGGPLTADPTKAIDFTGKESELARALDRLIIPGDESYAFSGVRVDSAPMLVEMEVSVRAIASRLGREPRASSRPPAQKM